MVNEKELKKVICKVIAEGTGTPEDFQEGHCGTRRCADCIFSQVPQAVISAGFGNVDEAVNNFAKKLEENICKYSTYDGWSVLSIIKNQLEDFAICRKE